MSQHCRLRETVPALHQVNHIQHCQEGQGDVDVSARARTLQVQDVIIVGYRRGFVVSTKGYGGWAENGHATESAPGERGKAAVHEEGQEEALPMGLPTQGGGQRLLDWPLLWGHRGGREGEGKRGRGEIRCWGAADCTLRTALAQWFSALKRKEFEKRGWLPGRESLTKEACIMGIVGSSAWTILLKVRVSQSLLHQFRPYILDTLAVWL